MCQGIKAGYRSITSFCRPISVWLTASDTQGLGALEVLTRQGFPSPTPNILVQSPIPWASLLPSPPGPLFLHALYRPHRYHSGPASAFDCFPWGDRSPRSVGKSFWWPRERSTWWMHTQSALLYYLRKAPVSPLLQGKLLNSDRKGVSGSVQRHCDSTLSLWWPRKTTHSLQAKYLTLPSAFLRRLSEEGWLRMLTKSNLAARLEIKGFISKVRECKSLNAKYLTIKWCVC